MEVAGLALSAMAMVQLYSTCADAFSLIKSVRKAPHDFEVALIKLEVERIRFLTWADTVGLASVDPDRAGPQPGMDQRLYKADIKQATCDVMIYMAQIFQNSEALKKRYGLKLDPAAQETIEFEQEQRYFILDSVFKRAHSSVSRNTQASGSKPGPGGGKRKMVRWVIADKAKFQQFIIEIRSLNDSLIAMFPDISARTRDAMRRDMEESDEVESLQLLQEAASEDGQAEISDTVSVRLITLGATAATITDFLDDRAEPAEWVPAPDINRETTPRPNEQQAEVDEAKERQEALASLLLPSQGPHGEGPGSGLMAGPALLAVQYAKDDRHQSNWTRLRDERMKDKEETQTLEEQDKMHDEIRKEIEAISLGTPLLDELYKLSTELESFVKKRELGSLHVSVYAPSYSSRITTSTSINGDEGRRRGFRRDEIVRFPHEALKSYHIKKFCKKRSQSTRFDDYESPTDEDHVYFDPEARPSYHAIVPGTITVEGYGFECWSYGVMFGKKDSQRIMVNAAKLPGMPARKLLRRIEELRTVDREIGWARDRAHKDLEEFAGKIGYDYPSGSRSMYEEKEGVISGLFMLLNRSDCFHDFSGDSSVSALAIHNPSEDALPLWNFFWQVILSYELIRRSNPYPDGSYAGFTGKILSSMIIADQWLDNCRIVLEDDGNEKPEVEKIEDSKDESPAKKEEEKDEPWDKEWDITGRTIQFHSLVHERQIEGLLRFASLIKWPYINEARDYAEDAYINMRGGKNVPLLLWDWLFGLTLPGKYMSFKVMAALIICTPTLAKELGTIAHYYDCGLILKRQSYWRSRTVLGRVLGALPGVHSICGWIGPCPPATVAFIDETENSKGDPTHKDFQARYINLKSRPVAPPDYAQDYFSSSSGASWGEAKFQPNPEEDLALYVAEVRDPSMWIMPENPVKQLVTCKLKTVRLRALPLDTHLVAKGSKLTEEERKSKTNYRAELEIDIDGISVWYKLYTNPIFVKLPPCQPVDGGRDEAPGHKVHMRLVKNFNRHVYTIESLKDINDDELDANLTYKHGNTALQSQWTAYDQSGEEEETEESFSGIATDVMVINATGKGAELVARAWCSERGRNAIVRRQGDACYTCALRAAGRKGLSFGVLIWVS